MGGGGSNKQAQDVQLQTAQEQNQLQSQYADMAKQIIQYGQNLQQPLVNFATKLTSGDPTAVMQAAAPGIANISSGARQATEQVYNTVPAGAGRQEALAQIPVQAYGQSANYLNNVVNNAYGTLAQLGSGQLNLGVQQEGASQGAGTLASGAAGQVVQQNNQRKASTLGFLGSLAGAASSGAGMAIGG